MAEIEKEAPDFSGKALIKGQIVDITQYSYRNKYVMLMFYKCNFLPDPLAEILTFSKRAFEFRQIECEVIGVTCETEYSHLVWAKMPVKDGGLGSLDIPLIADKSGRIARNYGVYHAETGLALRSVFIIDRKGILRSVYANDGNIAMNIDETLRLVQAFQYNDIYGDVCPIGWNPCKRKIVALKDGAFSHDMEYKGKN